MNQFSIIIPTWNNLAYLKLCIESIRKNSHFSNQIIVFVNDGSDGTNEWIRNQSDVDFRGADKNVGICVAVNSCRELVKSKYIVYMNDDMYVCPGWDLELSAVIDQIGHDQFMLSSTLIEPKPVSNPSYVSIVKDFGDSVDTFREHELLTQFDKLGGGDWSGSSWPPSVVSTKMWDIVGGYSIEFSPGMYSDPDFSMKLWKFGVRIFKGVAKSKAYHFQSKSTGKVKKNKGNEMFFLKWGISAKTFYREYLKMGNAYGQSLQEPEQPSLAQRSTNKLKLIYKGIRYKY